MEALVASILEQKAATRDAFAAWGRPPRLNDAQEDRGGSSGYREWWGRSFPEG
jgi:hypothetical protein